MDTFTITAYNKATDVVTVSATIGGVTTTGLKFSGVPKDSIKSVKAFFKAKLEAHMAGKAAEVAAQADIADEVKTLLNVATPFI